MTKINYELNYKIELQKRQAFYDFFEKNFEYEQRQIVLNNLCEKYELSDSQQASLHKFIKDQTKMADMAPIYQMFMTYTMDKSRNQTMTEQELFEQFLTNPFVFNALTFNSIMKNIEYCLDIQLLLMIYFYTSISYKIHGLNVTIEHFAFKNPRVYHWTPLQSNISKDYNFQQWFEMSEKHSRIINSMLNVYRKNILNVLYNHVRLAHDFFFNRS